MANCKRCKTNVGCGCNLKDGLCAYCYDQDRKSLTINKPNNSTNQTVSTPVSSTSLKNQSSGVATLIGSFNLLT